ncbi:unnamed protein product, partial [Didymodactylos carnosus]
DNQSTSLWLKNNINPTYRPQGKSDCFPINGRNAGIPQPPHYIKDERNGFPIIMIPDKYRHEKHLLLEISWLTIPYNGQRYYSPYKFQRDHKDKNVKDRNPVYYEINEQELLNNEIKLKLVCIRSLLKELENVQPLELYKPDSHYHQVNQPLGRMLTLRELIQKYQLQKSQMAFTLCRYYDSNRNVDNAIDRKTAPLTNEINQNNIQRLIETTVISNVMTEDKRRQRKITLENDETAETSTLQINRRTKRRNGGEITTIVSNKKCRGLSSEVRVTYMMFYY